MKKGITALIIMDGFGINPNHEGNAIYQAGTPHLDALKASYPNTQIGASGMDVGLPDGQMGNSEVGHMNMGAGRIVYQELTRITKSISDGDFFENPAFLDAIANCKKTGGDLHLMGLLSDGGVHSHIEHLFALIRLAKKSGLKNVYVHCFMDGRDVPPSSGIEYVRQLQDFMDKENFGKIATVSGRYYAMDRDKRWDRVQRAYDAIVCGKGLTAISATEAMAQSYEKEETDEFVQPTVVLEDGKPVAQVKTGDSVIFFNFRPDRTRELTRSMIEPEFDGFEREGGYQKVFFVSMTKYDETFTNLEIAFKPQTLKNTLGEYVASKGLKQLRIAETEKYAHVTFFFNGGVEEPFKGEDRILINSPKVATYDLQPEMSSAELTEKLVAAIESGKYDTIICNYPNGDMVGHTGVMEAAVKAVEALDHCVEQVAKAVESVGGQLLITADHGNAEQMRDPSTGQAHTAHTNLPVPLIYVGGKNVKAVEGGKLSDIAPTMLTLMGMEIPQEMTGKPLFIVE